MCITPLREALHTWNVNEDQDPLTPIIHHPPRGPNMGINGVAYHRIDSQSIHSAHAEVSVTLDGNGKTFPVCIEFLSLTITYMETNSRIFAGLIRASISNSGQLESLERKINRV